MLIVCNRYTNNLLYTCVVLEKAKHDNLQVINRVILLNMHKKSPIIMILIIYH